MIVNEQAKYKSWTFIWALWTRPRIWAVPTPRATPENRLSTSRVMLLPKRTRVSSSQRVNRGSWTHLQASAHSGLTRVVVHINIQDSVAKSHSLIVCWAPLSTKAFNNTPFTSTGMLHTQKCVSVTDKVFKKEMPLTRAS